MNKEKQYIDSVDGEAHMSAVNIIRELEAANEKLKNDLDTYKTIVNMLLQVPEINHACMKAIKALKEKT